MTEQQKLELREEQYDAVLASFGADNQRRYEESADQYLIGCLMALASEEQWAATLAGLKGVISVAMERDALAEAATR